MSQRSLSGRSSNPFSVASCALRVEGQTGEQALRYFYFAGGKAEHPAQEENTRRDLDLESASLAKHPELLEQDLGEDSDSNNENFPMAIVPLIFQERFIGALQVTAAVPSREWEGNELLLLRVIACQIL